MQGVFQKIGENGHEVHVCDAALRRCVRLGGKIHARLLCFAGVGAQYLVDHQVRAPRGEFLQLLLLLLKIGQDGRCVARPRHGRDAGIVVPLVVADAAALLLRPAHRLHIACQVFDLLPDERFPLLPAHVNDIADAQDCHRREGTHRRAEYRQCVRLHTVVQPHPRHKKRKQDGIYPGHDAQHPPAAPLKAADLTEQRPCIPAIGQQQRQRRGDMQRRAHKILRHRRAVRQENIAQIQPRRPCDAAHAEECDQQIQLFPEAVCGHGHEHPCVAEKAHRQRNRQPQRYRQKPKAQVHVQQQNDPLRAPQQRRLFYGISPLLHQKAGGQQHKEDRQSHIEHRSDVPGVSHQLLTSSR